VEAGATDLFEESPTPGRKLLATSLYEYEDTNDMYETTYMASDETPVSCDVNAVKTYSAILMESGKLMTLSSVTWRRSVTVDQNLYLSSAT